MWIAGINDCEYNEELGMGSTEAAIKVFKNYPEHHKRGELFKSSIIKSESKYQRDQGWVENKPQSMKWEDFTNNTTFHGIRYIFSNGPFRIRR